MAAETEKTLSQWIVDLCGGGLERQIEAAKHVPRPLHGQPFGPPIPRNPAVEQALVELGPSAQGVLRALIAQLRGKTGRDWRGHFKVLAATSRVLEQMGPFASAVVPELIDVLHDGDRWNIYVAARALKELGPDAVSAVPALFEAFEQCDNTYLYLVGEALIAICPFCPEVRSRLIAAVDSSNANLRVSAITTLGHMGSEAEEAVPRLMELAQDLKDEHWPPIISALSHLGRLDASFLGVLLAASEDSRWYVRREAIWALGRLAVEPDTTVPYVQNALSDEEGYDGTVQQAAVEALGAFGPRAEPVVPKLLELLAAAMHDGDHEAAVAVVRTLGKIGRCAQAALPVLHSFLQDQDERLQIAARKAIAAIAALPA